MILSKCVNKKFRQCIILFQHLERDIKDLRQCDKINPDILILSPPDSVLHVLIKKKQITLLQGHFLSIQIMGDRSLTHIHNFNVIMPMGREIDKPAVRAHRNQTSLFQETVTINFKFNFTGIKFFVDSRISVQIALFFRRYLLHFPD